MTALTTLHGDGWLGVETPLTVIPSRNALLMAFSKAKDVDESFSFIKNLGHSKKRDLFPKWKEETAPARELLKVFGKRQSVTVAFEKATSCM
jgi:hypothetical protein